MSIIDVQNLKEIKLWEGYFTWFKILQKRCEEAEENVKEMGQFLEVYILQTTNPISLKFVM